VWQLLHSTTTLVAFVLLWRQRRTTALNDLYYISLIYVAIFALSPIYSPRYFYAVFVVWAATLASGQDRPNLLAMSPRLPSKRWRRERAGLLPPVTT
jgi:hypothetical protein